MGGMPDIYTSSATDGGSLLRDFAWALYLVCVPNLPFTRNKIVYFHIDNEILRFWWSQGGEHPF